MRGSIVGGTNARTQLNLTSNGTTSIFNAASPSLYHAGELTGWVILGTSQKFYFQAPFAQNAAGTNWNISPSYVGETPPAGFSITMNSSGVVQVTCPTFSGTGVINYALNAPAVGATFPLAVDAGSITTGTVASARLPVVVPGTSAGVVAAAGLPGNTTGNTIATGYVGEKVTWTTPPSNQTINTTIADWTNASITLSAGVWLVQANVCLKCETGATSGAVTNALVFITDSSNTTVQNQEKLFGTRTNATAIARNEGSLSFSFLVNLSSVSTTYKIRVRKDDSGALGTASIYNQSTLYSEFFAIRIA